MRLDHPAPFGPTWRASWIWFERPAIVATTATRPELVDPHGQRRALPTHVRAPEVPGRAPCRLWSDGRYLLEVNGVEAARGPVRSDPRRAHYDVVDLAPLLRSGTNVIAVTARHYGDATSWWTPVPPTYSLGGGSLVLEALIGDDWLVTDDRWRAAPGDGLDAGPGPRGRRLPPVESFDAGVHPGGWRQAGFDDGGWRRAVELAAVHTGGRSDPHPPSEPFGMLRPPVRSSFPGGALHPAGPPGSCARAALPRTSTRCARCSPTRPTEGGDLAVHAFDLGHIAAGTVRLRIEDAPPGTVVDVAAAEHVTADRCAGTARPARGVPLRLRRGSGRGVRDVRRDRHPTPPCGGPLARTRTLPDWSWPCRTGTAHAPRAPPSHAATRC